MKRRARRFLAALAVVVTGCAHIVHVSPRVDIVGTWRLIEYWNRDGDDQPKWYPYGQYPLGYVVYDRGGNVLIQFAKSPQPPRQSKEDLAGLPAEELRSMIQEYVAYFGTFNLEVERGVVIHHVTADLRREYTGTDQTSPFRLSGDELIIGDSRTWLRRFVRVR